MMKNSTRTHTQFDSYCVYSLFAQYFILEMFIFHSTVIYQSSDTKVEKIKRFECAKSSVQNILNTELSKITAAGADISKLYNLFLVCVCKKYYCFFFSAICLSRVNLPHFITTAKRIRFFFLLLEITRFLLLH